MTQVEQKCRAHKISFGTLHTILLNGRYTYNDVAKIIEVCKEINTRINWSFPTLREVRDYFYTLPRHTLPDNLEKSLFLGNANPTMINYYKICDYYFKLKYNQNKKTECDTQCSV